MKTIESAGVDAQRANGPAGQTEGSGPRPPLVLPLAALDRRSLPLAGGKAANLGELIRAGLPVPPGFCVTTEAYRLVASGAALEPVLDALERVPPANTARLEELAVEARERLLGAPVPEAIAAAIGEAYEALGGSFSVFSVDGGRTTSDKSGSPGAPSSPFAVRRASGPLPVAVRSSATAEDLPTASFAGQQDTYLNIVGREAVLDAVRHCWASLWTGRAVAYRAKNEIDHRTVQLAVVVQQMVDAAVAGVLFTANPLTGRRRQAVIDANPGLGEAVVSGAVTPDHFVVDAGTGEIVERRLGDKRLQIVGRSGGGTDRVAIADGATRAEPCLTDQQLRELTRLGARVEAYYRAPQDIEWALGDDGTLWLVQSRPITTLFPLPEPALRSDELRAYFSFNVAQGVFRPFTPMGIQAFRLLASGLAAIVAQRPLDPFAGPGFLVEAGGRLFLDVTPVLRNRLGRRLVILATQKVEARSSIGFQQIVSDPRLRLTPVPAWRTAAAVLRRLLRAGIPQRALRAIVRPSDARRRAAQAAAEALTLSKVPPDATATERLDAVQRLLVLGPAHFGPRLIPVVVAGLGAYAIAGRLLAELATAGEMETVMRGLPHNPTTEMDLRLWDLAHQVRSDRAAAKTVRERPVGELVGDYHNGALPPALQRGLEAFLREYGHRAVAEIDIGLPRWSEDPAHILGAVANYLKVDDLSNAPDVHFARAVRQAETMVDTLSRRAARTGRLRGLLVRLLLNRARALAGMREAPKFYIVAVMARARALLRQVGAELAQAGRIEHADDVFFLNVPEARAALAGADVRPLVRERRASYERELRRRHVPRVLLSDGTEPEMTPAGGPATDGAVAGAAALRGTPASAGTVTGTARVILDPHGARLEPGEILVAPSTDPGWTPLFLTAGGLVMEMGGPMSHGAVVAREYGIPAVVGLPGATERITTGQRITVDGASGTVTLDE